MVEGTVVLKIRERLIDWLVIGHSSNAGWYI